ncbi:MAG: right-handed parallel beta-helix repeat-containing protein, partial [Candidatus Zixiibacteriota bacterium]
DNWQYDFVNTSPYEIDAKYNYWGDSTTAEMNQGGNPKNIARIYDQFDDGSYGFVDYSNWIGQALDLIKPVLTIISAPSDSEIIAFDSISFEWSATDNMTPADSIQYSFQLDAGIDPTWYRDSTNVSYYDLMEGWHLFRVRAKDAAGLIAVDSIIFATDVTPPNTFLVTGPEDSGMVNSTFVEFVWSGSDNISLPENLLFSYKMDDEPNSEFLSDTGHIFEVDEGYHVLTVVARDEAGHVDETPLIINFLVGLTELTIDEGPSDGQTIRVESVEFAWHAVDNTTPPDSMLYSYRLDTDAFTSWGYDTSVTFNDMENGTHSFIIRAKNLNDFIVTDSVYFSIDLGPHTALASFTDSAWNNIGLTYPPGSETAFVEIVDEDMDINPGILDSVQVALYSESGDTEFVYLHETDENNGIFHGSIPFDIQTVKFMTWFESSYPKDENLLSDDDYMSLMELEYDKWNSDTVYMVMTSSDQLFQVAPGDRIWADYYDVMNEWNENDTVTTKSAYGGWAGYVSGDWTAVGNPYVIMGDITIDYYDTLTIEPGVEVLLMPGVSINVNSAGLLKAAGMEGDSVYFGPRLPGLDSAWLRIYGHYGAVDLSYAIVDGARVGILADNTLSLMHCLVTGCGYSQYSPAVRANDPVLVNNCLVTGNMGYGFYAEYAEGLIDSSIFSFNGGTGIYLRYSSQLSVSHNLVSNNNGAGINTYSSTSFIDSCIITGNLGTGGLIASTNGSSDSLIPIVRHCELYGNAGYDLMNYSYCDNCELDAKANWWGDITTAEMNSGGNPKNIAKIFDGFDNATYGYVNYSNWVGCTESGVTGTISFIDSVGNVVELTYPAMSDSAYVEVCDTDLDVDINNSDSVEILIESESGDSETIQLHETSPSSGVFRGSIAFQPQVKIFVNWLEEQYPDLLTNDAKYEFSEALEQEYNLFLEEAAQINVKSIGDSQLQLTPGDFIRAIYIDQNDDWSNVDTISQEVSFGGWAGYVSGVWTASENPYVIVGDIEILNGDTLIIEPGVELRFMPGVSLQINSYGLLKVQGVEGDSVYFKAKIDTGGYNSFWGQIRGGYGNIIMSYAVVKNASFGIQGNRILQLDHCLVTQCGMNDAYYLRSAVQAYDPQFILSECLIANNYGRGLWCEYARGVISNCSVSANGVNGLYLDECDSIWIHNTNVEGNYGSGILTYRTPVVMDSVYVIGNTGAAGIDIYGTYSYQLPLINNCALYDNNGYDLRNNSAFPIDARSNWWGTSTTDEMNLGGNPKNISEIYDYYDYSSYGIVDYSGWIGASGYGTTGEVAFMDSLWSDVLITYPPLCDSARIQITDPDMNANAVIPDTLLV